MNLVSLLVQAARERADAPALVESRGGKTVETSFRTLDNETQHGAAFLRRLGLKAGDHALVLQPLSIRLYVVVLSLLRMGAVVVLPDVSGGRRQFEHALDRLRCRAFIGSPRAHLLRLLVAPLRRIPLQVSTSQPLPWTHRWNPTDEAFPVTPVPPTAPAIATFTSGSTGRPKALVRSHGFLLEQERILRKVAGTTSGQRELSTLPMFVLANLARGVTTVLPDADLRRPSRADPRRLLRQIARTQPHGVTGSPALLLPVARAALGRGEFATRLHIIQVGGGPVLPHMMDLLHEWAPQATVEAVYGSSEAEPIATVRRDQVGPQERRATEEGGGLLLGPPLAEAQVVIHPFAWGERLGPWTDQEFRRRLLPQGEVGEILVSGPHVLPGYLDGVGDEETKIRVDDQVWHRTGDAGRLDEAGRLWLMGRLSARVEDDRGVLWPLAVEAAARTHASIENAALVSIKGRRLLVVESSDDAATRGLKDRLAWAGLDEVRNVRSIPMDRRHNAKVDYPRLMRSLGA